MKVLCLLLFVSICTHSNGQNFPYYRLQEFGLKGKVVSISENTYDAEEKFGEIQKKSVVRELSMHFDEKGRIQTKEIAGQTSNGFERKLSTFIYDDDGIVKEEISSDFKTKFKCDRNRNVIEQLVYSNDGELLEKKTYERDNLGRIVGYTSTSPYGENEKAKYFYDSRGFVIKKTHTGYNPSENATLKYDNAGNVVEILEKDLVAVRVVYKYTFDKTGNYTTALIFRNHFNGIYGDIKTVNIDEIKERNITYVPTKEEKERARIEEENRLIEEEKNKIEEERINNERIRLEALQKEQESQRLDEIEKEKKRKEKEELDLFLKVIETRYFDLDSLSSSQSYKINDIVIKSIYKAAKDLEFEEFSMSGDFELFFDGTSVTRINSTKVSSSHPHVIDLVAKELSSIIIDKQEIRGYDVKTKLTQAIKVLCTKGKVSFKLKRNNDIELKISQNEKVKKLIRKNYNIDSQAHNLGSYVVKYHLSSINGHEFEETETLKYKLGLGGFIDYIQN